MPSFILGLSCIVNGSTVHVGNEEFMIENDIELTMEIQQDLHFNESQSFTCVLGAVDGVILGLIAITDPIKPEASITISTLENMGIKCYLSSGDNVATVQAVAEKVGIHPDRVFGKVLPQNKSKKVQELQNQGRIVAMIGDGINDSPALGIFKNKLIQ